MAQDGRDLVGGNGVGSSGGEERGLSESLITQINGLRGLGFAS